MPTIPASGWYARVTAASGYVHEPRVIEDAGLQPTQNPKANQRPSIRLPIAKADHWEDILGDGSSDIDLEVWNDGVKQPIDTLVDVDQRPGHTVLVGEGGRELKTRVEASYDQQAAHTAAENLIDNNTTYVSNVDTPNTTTETNTTLVTWTTNSDWLTHTDIPDTQPAEISSGTINLQQTCFTKEAEDPDRVANELTATDATYSDGNGANLSNTGQVYEYDFTPQYDIPTGELAVAYRNEGSGSPPSLDWYLEGVNADGTTVLPKTLIFDNTNDGLSLDWRVLDQDDGFATNEVANIGLSAGVTYTLYIEVPSGTADARVIDVVAPRDRRFSYTDDNDNGGSSQHLDGPELYPDEAQVKFDLVPAPQAVTGIRAEATLDEGDSDYTHYVSNDQGANFTSGSGANFETDSLGASFGPGVTYKAGLSRTGTRDGTTPETGHKGTDLQALTLKADLEDMPLVVNRTFDGHLDAILRELAEIGDQLWEYRRTASTESIEWTTPGQRQATRDPAVNDYSATKTTGTVYQKAIVYGQPDVEVRAERFESNHGVAVSLGNDRLQQGSERVTDPDTGERFRSGEDYTMDYQAGEITVLASGDMADATTFEIDYRYQAFGEFDDGTASPNVTPRIDLPGLWSDFLCEQAARLIVNEVNKPIHTAQVTLPNDETGWSVIDAIAPGVVPTGGHGYGTHPYGSVGYGKASQPLHIRNVENTPEATVLTLGSRRSLSDVVGDIRAQIGAVSQKA